jgi:putative PIG3 family NAD(P)H quinone oxidoreductase
MRAIEISAPGGPDVLRLVERPVPEPAEGEILVRVAAAGVNRPDILQREGKYPPPAGASDLPGLEIAGRVEAVGAGVDAFARGDRVCALVSGGGYAEMCVAPAPQTLPVPRGLDFVSAAAVPETTFTVWTNLFERGRLVAGDWALIHGGSGGIGTTAIQLSAARGARVLATARGDKRSDCERLGATRAIDPDVEELKPAVEEATHGRGVDVILDVLGGPRLQSNLDLLAVDGRLVVIGLLEGARGAIDLRSVLARRLTISGSTLRPRSVAEKGAIAAAVRAEVWPLFESGRVRPLIDRTFPLAGAAEAHRRMERREHVGKIVLVVDAELAGGVS